MILSYVIPILLAFICGWGARSIFGSPSWRQLSPQEQDQLDQALNKHLVELEVAQSYGVDCEMEVLQTKTLIALTRS